MGLKQEYLARNSPAYPDKVEYMEISPETNRTLASAIVPEFRSGIAPIALEYKDTVDGEVLMRHRPDHKWNTHTYIYHEEFMIWMVGDLPAQSWKIIRAQDMPPWWEEFRKLAWERMDRRQSGK